jgi:hypothetical protein
MLLKGSVIPMGRAIVVALLFGRSRYLSILILFISLDCRSMRHVNTRQMTPQTLLVALDRNAAVSGLDLAWIADLMHMVG